MNIVKIMLGILAAAVLLVASVFYQDFSIFVRKNARIIGGELELALKSYENSVALDKKIDALVEGRRKKTKAAVNKGESYIHERDYKKVKTVAPDIAKAVDIRFDEELKIYIYSNKYRGIMSQLRIRAEKRVLNPEIISLELLKKAVAERDDGRSGIINTNKK